MAYGQKYQLQFTDLDKNVIKVIISQDGYSGALMNFIGSENPIVTKLDKSGDDRFEPLKPTSMEIGIFVDTAGWIVGQESSNFEEFYEIDNFEYRVDKYVNTILDWSGYINDEVFTEPYQQGKYIVHLTATDGMSILKGRYTELTGISDDRLVSMLGSSGISVYLFAAPFTRGLPIFIPVLAWLPVFSQ